MARSDKVIDSLDLQISLTPGAEALLVKLLEKFISEHDFVEVEPRIRKSKLIINSTDFVSLLGYLQPADWNEFELRRFLSEGKKQCEQQLIRSTSLQYQSHYKWCMGAIKSLPLGRFSSDDSD